jgi:hypothetical protein
VKDKSRPGDRRRQVEALRAAELRLQHLLDAQYRKREELRREGAADALFGIGDKGLSRMD